MSDVTAPTITDITTRRLLPTIPNVLCLLLIVCNSAGMVWPPEYRSDCSAEVSCMKLSSRSVSRRLRLADLTPDPRNANRGTVRGRDALARSLSEYGAGRAVLIDRRGRIIAGNKTVQEARRLNIPLRVVETDGESLVAVKRTDLDLATDPRARALAIADNRVGELDLEWDVEM